MSRNPGLVVKHLEKDWVGIAYNADQLKDLKSQGKVIVKWFEDMSFKKRVMINGKEHSSIIHFTKFTQVGFSD